MVKSHVEYYLDKYADSNVAFLINRKLLIHKQLEKPTRTYVVYSDLHGSYEKFVQWLKNGMGYYRIAISEILGQRYSDEIYTLYERLLLIVNRARIAELERFLGGGLPAFDHQSYFMGKVPFEFVNTIRELEKRALTRKRILKDLLDVARKITRGDEHRIFKAIPGMFQENMLKLYFRQDRASYEALLDGIAGDEKLYHLIASYLVKLIIVNMLEKHVNLGDTFDRGDGADKLIAFYRAYFDGEVNSPWLHYLWGNHDILWMGASVGIPMQCVTALRISLRYNNMEFLYRYGFSVDKLQAFARKCYRLSPTGRYIKASGEARLSLDHANKMTKVLLVLETKLTLQYLRRALEIEGQIDYAEYAARFEKLLDLLPTGVPEDADEWKRYMEEHPIYSDVYFPTVDPDNPEQLTDEEQEIVDDLVRQFTTLEGFQDDMKWLFWKGEMYRVVDNTLYYHAAIPAEPDMEMTAIKGMKGKKLLDWLQRDLKRIGRRWQIGEPPKLREQMLLWYLWCGKESPFFCKSKMATLERAVLRKEASAGDPLTTWTEEKNLYYEYVYDDRFLSKILKEFHAEKLVMGHTPVQTAEEGRLSLDLMAFIIDGGASEAYGDRGAILIISPEYIYLTFHPSLEELMQAERENRLPDVKIMPLEERTKVLLRHSEKGFFLRAELNAIDELLRTRLGPIYRDYFK